MNWEYIGDGVYLGDDGWQLWLAVDNPDNMVVALDGQVFAALVTRGVARFEVLQKLATPPDGEPPR